MLITITGKGNNMTIDELRSDCLELGLAMNGVAMRMCDDCLERTKDKMNLIESIANKWYKRLKELEEAGEDDRK